MIDVIACQIFKYSISPSIQDVQELHALFPPSVRLEVHFRTQLCLSGEKESKKVDHCS